MLRTRNVSVIGIIILLVLLLSAFESNVLRNTSYFGIDEKVWQFIRLVLALLLLPVMVILGYNFSRKKIVKQSLKIDEVEQRFETRLKEMEERFTAYLRDLDETNERLEEENNILHTFIESLPEIKSIERVRMLAKAFTREQTKHRKEFKLRS